MNCVEPEIAAATYLWDKVVPGNHPLGRLRIQPAPPAEKAFDRFCRDKGVRILSLPTGQGLIFKPLQRALPVEVTFDSVTPLIRGGDQVQESGTVRPGRAEFRHHFEPAEQPEEPECPPMPRAAHRQPDILGRRLNSWPATGCP